MNLCVSMRPCVWAAMETRDVESPGAVVIGGFTCAW